MIEDGNNYWRDVAYQISMYGRILKPNQLQRLDTTPRFEVRTFLKAILNRLEGIDGDVLDLGSGTNTGYYFGQAILGNRRLIAADISRDAYETILLEQAAGHLPHRFKVPDQFIQLDLSSQALNHPLLDSIHPVLTSMIDTARYLSEGSLRRILQELYPKLVPQGMFVLIDFEKLNKPEAQAMGEVRQLNGDENDKIIETLEELGFKEVEFILIKEEFGDKASRFAITGKKL